jgi:hypothetical protein
MTSRLTEAWCSKSKSSSVLRAGNPANPDAGLATVALAGRHLVLKAGDEVHRMGPGLAPRPLGQPGGGLGEGGGA